MRDPILTHFANVRRMQKFKAMIMVTPAHADAAVPQELEIAGLREQILVICSGDKRSLSVLG